MTPPKDAIMAAGRDWSIEVTPAGAANVADFAAILAGGTTVNVTFLPGSDPGDTVDVSARLRAEGMVPVPHIAARSIRSRGQLEGMVRDLADRAGVGEVLVIGGGVDNPVGEFASSMEILETGILQKAGIGRIGVAGHPEGSPDIDDDALARALEWKNDFARREGLDLYIETQFCFEPGPVVAWERRIREAGNDLPIRVGVPGPATIKTLLRFAQLSGIGPSMRMVTKQARNISKLLTVQSPDLLVAGLAAAMAKDPESRLAHFHYYPFGGLERTAGWAKAVEEGEFKLMSGDGFAIDE